MNRIGLSSSHLLQISVKICPVYKMWHGYAEHLFLRMKWNAYKEFKALFQELNILRTQQYASKSPFCNGKCACSQKDRALIDTFRPLCVGHRN